MKKKTLAILGSLIALTVITATAALALGGGNTKSGNDAGSNPPTMATAVASETSADVKTFEGKRGKSFGFGFDINVEVTDEQKAEALEQIKEQLDKQVADGKITREQADELYKLAENSEFGVMPKMNRSELPEIFGDFPKITHERSELTDEQKADMLEDMKKRLDELVSAGKITQEQADEMYESMKNGEMPRFGIRVRKNAGDDSFDVEFDMDFDTKPGFGFTPDGTSTATLSPKEVY